MARRIQQNIMQELRTAIGGAQALPENAAKDLILQVSVLYFPSGKNSVPSHFLWNFRIPPNLHFSYRVCIILGSGASCKLQAACYQEEGFSRIYLACAGSDAQHFINLLESMFSKVDEPDLEDLETQATKQM